MTETVKYTPEEDKKLGERTVSDANIIKGGGEFRKGVLNPTESQVEDAKKRNESRFTFKNTRRTKRGRRK